MGIDVTSGSDDVLLRRRWTVAPLPVEAVDARDGAGLRPTCAADDPAIAALLDAAYADTIDFDPDDDHEEELRTWRSIDGANDAASRLADDGGLLVGACLIGEELGEPFLYEVVVVDRCRRHGLATRMLSASLAHLAQAGHDACSAWVTAGNVASERLLAAAGFVPVTPAVGERIGVAYYRAATVVDRLDIDATVPAAVTVDEDDAVLWLFGEPSHTPPDITVGPTSVSIRWVSTESADADHIAATAMPVRRISWLLIRRNGLTTR